MTRCRKHKFENLRKVIVAVIRYRTIMMRTLKSRKEEGKKDANRKNSVVHDSYSVETFMETLNPPLILSNIARFLKGIRRERERERERTLE